MILSKLNSLALLRSGAVWLIVSIIPWASLLFRGLEASSSNVFWLFAVISSPFALYFSARNFIYFILCRGASVRIQNGFVYIMGKNVGLINHYEGIKLLDRRASFLVNGHRYTFNKIYFQSSMDDIDRSIMKLKSHFDS
jgi:hypothetical protein